MVAVMVVMSLPGLVPGSVSATLLLCVSVPMRVDASVLVLRWKSSA